MITKNQTYTEAIAAVTAGAGSVFACVASWPGIASAIGWANNEIVLYPGPVPYSPTDSDRQATNWQYGGDNPPR